jgi:hypothetical protein
MQKREKKALYLIFEVSSWIISIFLSIYVAITFFSNHTLWNDLPIVWDDFPVHIYRASLLQNIIFPQFHTLFGFINYFYAGSPEIHMYPIGIYLVLACMGNFGINLQIGIRILLFGTFIFNILTPHLIIKTLKIPSIFGPIATFWYTYGAGNTLWVNFLSYGMIAYCLSYTFTAILFARLIKIDFSKKLHVFPFSIGPTINENIKKSDLSRDFVNILLLCSIILFNFTTFIYFAFYLVFFILFHMYKRDFKSIIKNMVSYLIKIGIWMVLLTSFWLIPSIIIQYQYMGSIQHNLIFSVQHAIVVINDLISRGWTSIQAYFILTSLYIIIQFIFNHFIQTNKIIKQSKFQNIQQFPLNQIQVKINYTILITLTTFIFVLLTPYLNMDILSGINSYRYYVFFECFLPVFACLVILYVYYFIRSLIARIKPDVENKRETTNDHRNLRKSPVSKKNLSLVIVFSLITIIPVLYSTNLFFYNITPSAPEKNTLDFAIVSKGTEFYPFSYVRWEPGYLDLIEWIKSNTDSSTRILMENSGEEGGLRLGGHSLGLVALWTEREFIGGYISHYWYEEANESAFQDSKLFGMNISEISTEYALEQCLKFNIEYIIAWSDSSLNFFNEWNRTIHSELVEMGNVSWFYLYKIVNPLHSWVFSESSYPEIKNMIRTQQHTNFILTNVTEDDIVYYSLHDFYNWHIYVNGTEVSKINNKDKLMAFKVPNAVKTSDYSIQIIWEVSSIEIGSNILSMLSMIVFFTSLIGSIHTFYLNIIKRINRRLFKRFIKFD